MQDSNTNILRQGFVFGFGLIIPLAIGFLGYNVIGHKIYQALIYEKPSSYESYKSKEDDYTKKIEVINFKDTREGDSVIIVGAIKNTATKKISSIELEAEFFNSKGEFVYEENEYISKNLEPNEVENFAIKCGCASKKIPEYSKVTVRVVSANDY